MASPKGIRDACTYLTKVYGARAKAQLGDDLAKDLLFDDLEGFTDEEVGRGVELMRRGQENVFADGQSIYAIILKWVRKAREELRRQRIHDDRARREELNNEEMRREAAGMTPEKMAINKLRIQLLSEGRTEDAIRFSGMPEEEQLEVVPDDILAEAKRMWEAAHRGHFSRLERHGNARVGAPPPCPLIPERTGGSE